MAESAVAGKSSIDWPHYGALGFFLLVVVFIATLLVIVVQWMTDANRLPLANLVVQGDLTYLATDDVREAILQSGELGSFMTQDVGEIQTAIESLPWVASASVRKQWPDVLKVYLVEHEPMARWHDDALLNTYGEVFVARATSLESLVRLAGPEGSSQEVMAQWKAMQQQLAPLDVALEGVTLSSRRAWRVWLDNGIRLELGRRSLEERLARFITLYPELNGSNKTVEYVDLRYDTGAAVGWQKTE
ncbi:cell division protein FtsQ/DivIB [Thaumasiovibrio subtropicus]|uniref:cell division protein FtsQ/DivIB n=1 Tax=Thaumasiovibrio subtropicus TaxID=1891207 RepID=UPI000B35535A|nr:cell division protein FtsQ/DivIB [Thaumasiovibrio subtropicus]